MAHQGLALVTGASNGIGYHLANQLAEQGCDLVIAGKDPSLTASVEQELKARGVAVSSYVGDLSKFAACTELWQTVEATGKPLKVACLNAGVGR